MKKQFTLAVSSPCSEQWDTFLPVKNGAFCPSCQKNVVDFTKMSEDEIVQFFEDNSTGICGRFTSDQLKPYHQDVSVISLGWNLFNAGILAILLMFATQPASAFVPTIKNQIESVEIRQNHLDVPEEEGLTIEGIVRDENNDPFPGVNIYVKNQNTIGTVSDKNGKFKLLADVKPGDILVFSFLGYEPVEYVVTKNIPQLLEIVLTDFQMMMGEVQIEEPYH